MPCCPEETGEIQRLFSMASPSGCEEGLFWHVHTCSQACLTPSNGKTTSKETQQPLTLPRLLLSVFVSSLILHPPPCVSVICTVSLRGVEEINSNSPFPLLTKMTASKNGKQYQLIYHELSISYKATSDLFLCLLQCCSAAGIPVVSGLL